MSKTMFFRTRDKTLVCPHCGVTVDHYAVHQRVTSHFDFDGAWLGLDEGPEWCDPPLCPACDEPFDKDAVLQLIATGNPDAERGREATAMVEAREDNK